MGNTWVVVADGTRARLFNRHKNRKLEEFDTLLSPEHRLHEGDLVSDRDGRAFDSGGVGRHAVGNKNAAKDHEMTVFAKRLAMRLEEGRNAGQLDRLVLIAPPRFLGQLRSHLSEQSAALVALTIDKELTTLPVHKLEGHVPEFF